MNAFLLLAASLTLAVKTGMSPKAVRYLHSRSYDSNVFHKSELPLGAFSKEVR